MDVGIKKKSSAWNVVSSIFFFSLSDKLKFSIKASLSMVLAFLIPLSQGWEQASTAAITIMLIAAMGSVSESILKGAMRALGTVIGAIIGMTLIALFPQDRMLYLISLSVIVSVVLYVLHAYKGDPSVFILTAMTMMTVFKNGEVDDVFIYGLDKTYMTIFGIMIYTLVGVFLWPVKIQDNSEENAMSLSLAQSELFLKRDASKEERTRLQEQLLHREQLLESTTMDVSTTSIDISQWHSMIHNYKNINEILTLLSNRDQEDYANNTHLYVANYKQLEEEIFKLLQDIVRVWKEKQNIVVPEKIEPEYELHAIGTLTHLERASLLAAIKDMQKLHEELRTLAIKLNSLHSPLPTFFALEDIPKNRRFLWGDIEDLKGALVTFLIFWAATFLWITINPPGEFMIVVLATGLSVLTTFTPVKPSQLIVVFSLSFIFSTFMYIWVLPNLHYGWELGLFIFIYSFISFHLLKPQMTIFFLLGLFTLGINNEMYYDFSIFLLVLLVFYLFLILLHAFYYVPFSTRSEHLFMTMKKRFFILSWILLKRGRDLHEEKDSLLLRIAAAYSQLHLMNTVKKMQLWGDKVDINYFDTIDKNSLRDFTKECEKFAYLLELLYDKDLTMNKNPLIKKVSINYDLPALYDLVGEFASGKEANDIDSFWKNEKNIVAQVQESLAQLLNNIDFNTYSKEVISDFYENISLRKSVWLSLFTCQHIMEKIDFKSLQKSRF